MSLCPMKRTRSTWLASLPQEATKNMGVYKISGSPKRKQGGGAKWLTIHKIKNLPTTAPNARALLVWYTLY